MLTESNAPRMSTKVAINNFLLLKEFYMFFMKNESFHRTSSFPEVKKVIWQNRVFSHQSNLDLSMCSKILHTTEKSAIGKKF